MPRASACDRESRSTAGTRRLAPVLQRHRVEAVAIVYQSICHFGQRRVVGDEALARSSAEPYRTPGVWFAEASGGRATGYAGTGRAGGLPRAPLPGLQCFARPRCRLPSPGRSAARSSPRAWSAGKSSIPSGGMACTRSWATTSAGPCRWRRRWASPRRAPRRYFHLMLQPMEGFCAGLGERPASTASAAARRSAPVTGVSLLGRLSSNRPR